MRLHNTANEFLTRRISQSSHSSSPNHSPESSVSSTNSNTTLTLRNVNGNLKNGEELELRGVFNNSNSNLRNDTDTGVIRNNSPTTNINSNINLNINSNIGSSSNSRGVQYNPQNGSGNNSTATILGEAMEQAEILRMELHRVHAGLSLLSNSVDGLGEAVIVNAKW